MTTNRQKPTTARKTTKSSEKSGANAKALSLEEELLLLSDNLAEFSDMSAFLCNAFAISLNEHEWLNKKIISGARICSNLLYSRTCELQQGIRQVNAHYLEVLHGKQNAK